MTKPRPRGGAGGERPTLKGLRGARSLRRSLRTTLPLLAALTACGRTGKVKAGQPTFDGTAEVITDPANVARAESLIKQKYGLEFRVVALIETIAARGRKPRVLLRITPSTSTA